MAEGRCLFIRQRAIQVLWTVTLRRLISLSRSLDRPYARVDRPKLKRRLLDDCESNGNFTTDLSASPSVLGVYFRPAKVESVKKVEEYSDISCSEGGPLKARVVLDATGHSQKLVRYDQKYDPGYQGAYGFIATVESHPFDESSMLFMDWRGDYALSDPDMAKRVAEQPTFLYAMPFSKTEIFLEETSLVARPIISFDDLKERLTKRLDHLGIKVLEKSEEEYCVIPMGGVLPTNPPGVISIGGSAGMVHPATGYMISRVLGAAPEIADSIIEHLNTS